MTTESLVLLIFSGISTIAIAVIGYFLKATVTDFKETLKLLVQDLRDLQGWRAEHSLSNRTSFKSLKADLLRCQKAIKRIRTRLSVLEDGDDEN